MSLNLAGQTSGAWQFSSVKTTDGLTDNLVSSTVEDQMGFIWIGTLRGLNRFDGHNLITYTIKEDGSPGLPSNHIQCLMVDSSGNIWIGTRDAGLCRYDPRTDEFFSPRFFNSNNEEVTRTPIFRIVQGRENEIYAAASKAGVFKVDLETLDTEVIQIDLHKGETENVNVHDIILSEAGFWIGSYGDGIIKYDADFGFVQSYDGVNLSNSLHCKEILRMIEGTYPDLWIATSQNYLHYYNRETGIGKVYDQPADANLDHFTIYDLMLQGKDSLWLATIRGGVQIFNIKEERFEIVSSKNHPGGVDCNSILSLDRSTDGTLWVGTKEAGLAFYHPATQIFEVYSKYLPGSNLLDFNSVRSIYADDHYLFVGGEEGLNQIDLKTSERKLWLADLSILSIAQHPGIDNVLFFGANSGQLILFDKEKGPLDKLDLKIPESQLENNEIDNIYAIEPLNDHEILLGTRTGCAVFDPTKKSVLKFFKNSENPLSIPAGDIRHIVKDSMGRIWVASTTAGLSLMNYETGGFEKFELNNEFGFISRTIVALHADSKGNLWIGTEKGLIKFNPERGVIKSISDANGLSQNYVVGIVEDPNGNLWLGTKEGLTKYNPVTDETKIYTDINGLPSNVFNIRASFKGPDQKIYFGCSQGLIAFKSEDIQFELPKPKPKFVDLLFLEEGNALDIKLPYVDAVYIDPHERFFSVEISAFDFIFDKKLRYRYRVKELSNEWIDIEDGTNIPFTEMKPATYTLEYMVSRDNFEWHSPKKPLTIIVKPALFQRPLIQIILGLFIFSLVVLFILARTSFLKKQKTELDKLVKIRTAELLKSENLLKEANQTKDKFFSILAHDLRSPFSSLLGLAGILQDEWSRYSDSERQKFVKGFKDNLESTFKLVNNLLDWSRLQQGKIKPELNDLSLRQIVDKVIHEMNASVMIKHMHVENKVHKDVHISGDEFMLSTILRNLLSNAIKYSPKGNSILISSVNESQDVKCCVEDFGTGISPDLQENLFNLIKTKSKPGTEGEKGTGLGLIVSRDFVELMGGNFSFESSPGKGSRFCFTLKRANLIKI